MGARIARSIHPYTTYVLLLVGHDMSQQAIRHLPGAIASGHQERSLPCSSLPDQALGRLRHLLMYMQSPKAKLRFVATSCISDFRSREPDDPRRQVRHLVGGPSNLELTTAHLGPHTLLHKAARCVVANKPDAPRPSPGVPFGVCYPSFPARHNCAQLTPRRFARSFTIMLSRHTDQLPTTRLFFSLLPPA